MTKRSLSVLARAFFVRLSSLPSGSGPLVATYIYCSGAEAELGDCYYYTFSSSYCGHQHDVGIRCLGECGKGGEGRGEEGGRGSAVLL